MGRPRKVVLSDNRQILLYNMTADDAAKIKALFDSAPVSKNEECLSDEFKYLAIGTYQSLDKKWHLVEVGYDPLSKEASVTSDKVEGDQKIYATEAFKKAAARNSLV